jgi:PEP-CTERM motif
MAHFQNNGLMHLRSTLAALLILCAQAATANTTYTFGAATNASLDSNLPVYTAGVWTEITNNTSEQIDCMVVMANITDTCGSPGPGSSQHIGIPSAPTNTAILPTGTTTYLEVDGDPTWGAPVSTDMTGLIVGQEYSVSFYMATNEENGNNKAYDDYWQVYAIPGTGVGPYICPVCSTPVNPVPADLVFTSDEQVNLGARSTPWAYESFLFTASSVNEILEFVTDAIAVNPGAFQPPFLDLAAVTSQVAPEPGTWVMTILGVGLVLIGSRFRRRNSGSSAAYKRVLGD